MNFKKYIKAEQKIISSDLTHNEKTLMQCLIIMANKFGKGDDFFYLTDKDILKCLGLSIKSNNTVRKARNKLIELGYISFKAGKSGSNSKYYINWDNIIGNEPIIQIDEEETF
jgi:hypothetical protein